MDTIFGMLIHDIPGNVINHGIFSSKINKGQKTHREVLHHVTHFTPIYIFKNLYIQEHGHIYIIQFLVGI